MTRITVSGIGLERAAAERATVTVQSHARAEHPEAAIATVSAAHAAACDDARGFVASGAADHWHAERVWVSNHELWVGDGQRRETVFDAAASVRVTFRDFDTLGAWIGTVASQPSYQVAGVEWSLTPESERALASRSRAQAIADAQAKAADFAAAAGLPAPRIAGIREGADDSATFGAQPAAMMRAEADSTAIQLAGSDIAVTSEVRVDFDA